MIGEFIEGLLKPHLIYMRRQGISLAVVAVFGACTVVFLLVALFFALLYAMPPLGAALLCALLSFSVAASVLMTVQRRARIRAAAGAEAVARREASMANRRPASGLAPTVIKGLVAAVLPTLLIAGLGYLVGRRADDD